MFSHTENMHIVHWTCIISPNSNPNKLTLDCLAVVIRVFVFFFFFCCYCCYFHFGFGFFFIISIFSFFTLKNVLCLCRQSSLLISGVNINVWLAWFVRVFYFQCCWFFFSSFCFIDVVVIVVFIRCFSFCSMRMANTSNFCIVSLNIFLLLCCVIVWYFCAVLCAMALLTIVLDRNWCRCRCQHRTNGNFKH